MTELPVAASGASALDVARRCADEGGAIALERFRGDRRIDTKGRGNVVTDADVAVELRIKEILAAEFPGHAVLSEETSASTDPSRGWCWVIDPIDGTKNYSVGIPVWCTNVALACDGEPLLGLTRDSVHGESIWAIAGRGAFIGEAPARASSAPDVESSVIGVDLGYDDAKGSGQIELMSRIFPRVQTIRILGSAALGIAYAGCGRLDFFTHMNLAPWDIAAGIVIVREAGGVATQRDGSPVRITSGTVAAGGPAVHADFMARYGGRA